MAGLEVRLLEPHETDTWDRFVELSPQGTLFHTSAWGRAIAAAYAPAVPAVVACFEEKTLVGGCVCLERERYGMATAVMPLLTPYAGFVLEEPAGEKFSDTTSRSHAILAAMGEYLRQRYAYLNLVLAPHLEDVRPLQQQGFVLRPRFTYYVNLRLPPEEHWGRFDGSARRQIRKAEKEPFEICGRLPLAEGYQLVEQTFSRHGQECPVPYRLFEAVVEHPALADHREILAAWHGENLVAFVVLLMFNRTLYYALAANHPAYLPSGVSSLLVWQIVKRYAGHDWNAFDFVGANTPSIARFKENFNPRLQLYFQIEHYGSPALRIGRELRTLLRGEGRQE